MASSERRAATTTSNGQNQAVTQNLPSRLQNTKDHLANTRRQLEEAKAAVDKPFPYEEDLTTKSARLAELNALLDMDRPENEIVDSDLAIDNPSSVQKRSQER